MESHINPTQVGYQQPLIKEGNIFELRKEIINGLSSSRKYIPHKFLYDNTGIKIFKLISQTPEYYLDRIEKQLLKKLSKSYYGKLRNVEIVDLESGDGGKASIIFNFLSKYQIGTIQYVPTAFNKESIDLVEFNLRYEFPNLNIQPFFADYTQSLPPLNENQKRIYFLFGNRIGNLEPFQAQAIFYRIGQSMKKNDELLIGVDMVKDSNIMVKAYNDSQMFTESFNRNIIRVVNSFLKTDIPTTYFEHNAFYNDEKRRIEMNLKARHQIDVRSPFHPGVISINREELIHTENSYKFTENDIYELILQSDLSIMQIIYDPQNWYALVRLLK